MGREIYAQIRDSIEKPEDEYDFDWEHDPHALWTSENYVCGRDEATGYVVCRTVDDDHVYAPLEGENLEYLRQMLEEYKTTDYGELDKAKTRLSDVLQARKNARNYEEFSSFDPEIENCEEFIKNFYSRADSLLALISDTLAEYESGKYDKTKCKPYLVVSE